MIRQLARFLVILTLLVAPPAWAEPSRPLTLNQGQTQQLPLGSIPPPVTGYGADRTGVTNSTAAFTAALAANGGTIYVPCGTYKLNLTVTAASTIIGAGSCTYLQPYALNAPVITYSGVNFTKLANLNVYNTTSTSDGVKLVAESGNVLIENVLFNGFASGAGVNCAMTVTNQSSGLHIVGGLSLSNAVGYRLTYCQDFQILGGNVGLNTTAGIALDHSGAGQIDSAYIWENGIGIDCNTCLYSWVTGSRITQSQTQGLRASGAQFINITNSQFYHNSSLSVGAAPDIALASVAFGQISGNLFYDWTGAPNVNYAITADSVSGYLNITGNTFNPAHQTVAPTNIDPAATNVTLADNTPGGINRANWRPVATVTVSTPIAGVGGTASLIYLSTLSGATEQTTPAPASGLMGCFTIFSSATPAGGETWTYTWRKNGSNTGMVSTQVNGALSTQLCNRTTAPAANDNDALSISVSTNGATNLGNVNFRGSMVIYQ